MAGTSRMTPSPPHLPPLSVLDRAPGPSHQALRHLDQPGGNRELWVNRRVAGEQAGGATRLQQMEPVRGAPDVRRRIGLVEGPSGSSRFVGVGNRSSRNQPKPIDSRPPSDCLRVGRVRSERPCRPPSPLRRTARPSWLLAPLEPATEIVGRDVRASAYRSLGHGTETLGRSSACVGVADFDGHAPRRHEQHARNLDTYAVETPDISASIISTARHAESYQGRQQCQAPRRHPRTVGGPQTTPPCAQLAWREYRPGLDTPTGWRAADHAIPRRCQPPETQGR